MQNEKYWKVWLFSHAASDSFSKTISKNNRSRFTSGVLLYNKDP